MAEATIEIEAVPRKAVTIKLVGQKYDIIPPKSSMSILMATKFADAKKNPGKVMKGLNGWIEDAFGEAQAGHIQERLADPKDDLDLPHIMKLMERLGELTTGDPTT